jgi:hypothetical protein
MLATTDTTAIRFLFCKQYGIAYSAPSEREPSRVQRDRESRWRGQHPVRDGDAPPPAFVNSLQAGQGHRRKRTHTPNMAPHA